MYNICFTLGDPSGDGHANTSEYHIVATHSVEEITNAYRKTTELLGFDYIKEVGTTEDVQYGPPAGCYWFDYAEDEFLEVFFNIVRYSLPYFQWTTRDLEEDTLYLLEGAAYGFAYHGE